GQGRPRRAERHGRARRRARRSRGGEDRRAQNGDQQAARADEGEDEEKRPPHRRRRWRERSISHPPPAGGGKRGRKSTVSGSLISLISRQRCTRPSPPVSSPCMVMVSASGSQSPSRRAGLGSSGSTHTPE